MIPAVSGQDTGYTISLLSPEGQGIFMESDYRENFWNLIRYYVTQDYTEYCSVASSTMVLNALGIRSPPSPEYDPYRIFTQKNFFTGKVEEIIQPDQVEENGMILDRLGEVLQTFPVRCSVYHAADDGLDAFRTRAKETLKSSSRYIIVNYLRSSIGQQTGGHYSPLAAYDSKRDLFLILDTARYKYPPVWISAEDLFNAMNTRNSETGDTRGYIVISGSE